MAEIEFVMSPSRPGPPGLRWDGRGTDFAVFSAHATAVELCLYDERGRRELARLPLPEQTGEVWHGHVHGARPGLSYGYRVHGPWQPEEGHRFNPHKLLLDPHARRLVGELTWHDALYGYRVGSKRADLTFDRRDSAPHMPRAVIVDDHFDWQGDVPPRIPWADTVIYELHLRGFTRLWEQLPERERGTFGALGHPRVIDWLRRLGVTAVELLPIHAFVRDRHLVEAGLTNYWGYNSLAWFAVEPAYLSDGCPSQLKWAVRELHAAGIEVLLDVVYNHTCEGNELGPTLSWRGLDNASYYRLLPEEPRFYINDTGCGNSLDFSHPRVIQLVMDSLRYWVEEYHIDGFRFDLGAAMGREPEGFDPGSGFFDALSQDPVLAHTKLIFEPWDLGPGGYQLGQHPTGSAEWNDRYRDTLRRFWRGDEGMRAPLASSLQGTAELFDQRGRRPWASVNFITAHDGFTLRDLVSYNDKHNEANGEDNQDGSDENYSHNWGVEGPSDDAELEGLRLRLMRSMLTSLLCSHGTPMLVAGDELGRTQQGNNNVYAQDNALSWLDWQLLETESGSGLLNFVRRLLQLRRDYPLLRCECFQHAEIELAPGLWDVHWFDERGEALEETDWDNPLARLLGLRRLARNAAGGLDLMLLLFNSDSVAHRFQLPSPHRPLICLVDSQDWQPATVEEEGVSREVAAHSVVVLASRSPGQRRD